MKLRFNIKTLTQQADPVFNCHNTLNAANLDNVDLLLKFANVEFIHLGIGDIPDFDILYPAGFTKLITLNDGSEVEAALHIEGNYFILDIPIVDIANYALLDITITSGGFLQYWNNNIKVYGYDLGNDLTVTDNPEFYFVLVQDNTIDYPYSDFLAYWKPFTNALEIVKNSSSVFTSIQYSNTVDTLSFANGHLCNDGGDITMVTTAIVPYLTEYITKTCTKVKSIDIFRWLPEYEIKFPCSTDNCIVEKTEFQFEIGFDFSVLDTLNFDDTEAYPYTTLQIFYDILKGNTILDSLVETLNIELGVTPTNYVHSSISTLLSYGGDLAVRYGIGALTSINGNTVTAIKSTSLEVFKGCPYFEIDRLECNDYRLRSYHTDTLPVTIKKFNFLSKEFETSSEFDLTSLTTLPFALPSDGIFDIMIEKDEEFHHYLLFNHCELNACIDKYIGKLMNCNHKCDPSFNCNASQLYDYNSIMVLRTTYLDYINKLYTNQYYFTTQSGSEPLDTDTLDTLYSIQDLSDKMYEYCTDCQSPCGCSDSNDSSTNCSEC